MQIWSKEKTIRISGIIKNNAEGKLLEDYTDYLASAEYWLKKLNEQIEKMLNDENLICKKEV